MLRQNADRMEVIRRTTQTLQMQSATNGLLKIEAAPQATAPAIPSGPPTITCHTSRDGVTQCR
jgi:hypothetical protein